MCHFVPASTPKVALRSETGLLSMDHTVMIEKVMLAYHIRRLEDRALAKQVYVEQLSRGWPGLAREGKEMCE